MKKIKTTTMVIWMLVLQFQVSAQSHKTKYSLEVDPITFAFKGYSLHVRVQPKKTDHLLIGLGIYAMNMPKALVNLNKLNRDKGWDVRINRGYSLFGEYHFNEVNRKWFVGSQIGIQEFKILIDHSVNTEQFQNLLAMGYFGYTFTPFENNFYIKPWAGLGYTTKLSGSQVLGEAQYNIAPITSFLTIHVGYTF